VGAASQSVPQSHWNRIVLVKRIFGSKKQKTNAEAEREAKGRISKLKRPSRDANGGRKRLKWDQVPSVQRFVPGETKKKARPVGQAFEVEAKGLESFGTLDQSQSAKPDPAVWKLVTVLKTVKLTLGEILRTPPSPMRLLKPPEVKAWIELSKAAPFAGRN